MMNASITSPIFTSPNFSMVMPHTPRDAEHRAGTPFLFICSGEMNSPGIKVLASRGAKTLGTRAALHLDLLHDEGLNHVPNLHIAELLNGNAA
ncbi:hypothetical protein, partial [Pseudoflavonifractor phocaeensis]|uniref:hypothetical protein n=1 Tax=Pseudoflavonifractor phocaeensis TaxID=1870988 RepID=UPI00210D663E